MGEQAVIEGQLLEQVLRLFEGGGVGGEGFGGSSFGPGPVSRFRRLCIVCGDLKGKAHMCIF